MAGTPPATAKGMPGPSDVPLTVGPIRFFFQEFLVDIFGGLVPGLVFLAGVWTALPIAVHMLYETASGKVYLPGSTSTSPRPYADALKTIGKEIGHVPATVWFFVFLGLIIVVYVFGQVFYRRGPKDADQASFSNMEKREMLGLLKALSARADSKEPVVIKFHGSVDLKEVGDKIRESWIGRWALKTRLWRIHELALRLSPSTRSATRQALGAFMRDNYGADSKEQCEFPYDHLDRYLRKRKLDHLVALVPWRVAEDSMPVPDGSKAEGSADSKPDGSKAEGSADSKPDGSKAEGTAGSKPDGGVEDPRLRRSKVYINVLKIRLMQMYPERCKQMVRNEADVRLASGVWHAAGTLRFVAVAGLGAFLVAFIVQNRYVPFRGSLSPTHWRLFLHDYFLGLAAAAVVLVLAVYFRTRIEQFLHYQRMREVVYVLDTAYAAFRSNPAHLVPPFDGFVEWIAQHENRGDDRRRSVRKVPNTESADGIEFTNISEDHRGACIEAAFDKLRFENGEVMVDHRWLGSARWIKQIPPAPGEPASVRVRVGVAVESPHILEKFLLEQARPPKAS